MATKARKSSTKSKAEREYEELIALVGPEYAAAHAGELEQQGLVAPETETEEASLEEQLLQQTDELEATHRDRLAADRVRANEPAEGSDKAARQAIADDLQRARGQALRQTREQQAAVRARVNSWADRLGTVRTPGGIGALLLILGLLLLLLIDVKGQPRLAWVWDVLLGRAHLMSESAAAAQSLQGRSEAAPTHTETPAAAATGSGSSNGAMNGHTVEAPANVLNLVQVATGDFSKYLNS